MTRHLQNLPKVFRKPVVLHDMVHYRFDRVPDEKFRNWIRMNRMTINGDSGRVPAYPYLIQVEPTNRCNLKCLSCPCGRGELEREPHDMSFGDFRRLVDDMGRYLLLMVLWSWGEPFMNRDLPKMIRYATENGIQTVSSTNCHFLNDEDFVADVMTAGLSSLIVAVDSTSIHSYAEYRREGNAANVVRGVENLVRIKRKSGAKTRINLRMVAMRQNEHEIDQVRSFARDLGADIFSVKTANPSSGTIYLDSQIIPNNPRLRRYLYHRDSYERVLSKRPCRRIWTMTNVHSNGDVVPCCRDHTSSVKLGNFLEEPLSRIWMSDAYSELRRNIYRNKLSIDMCRHCDESFKLSPGGWIPVINDISNSGNGTVGRFINNHVLKPRVRMLVNQVVKRI